ncbi:MAG: serine protein kinase, partial [Solirubrobacteraceae bacterium]
NIKELREEAEREGMHGISPRYVQDKISNALVAHPNERSINPFMVLNELEASRRLSVLTARAVCSRGREVGCPF